MRPRMSCHACLDLIATTMWRQYCVSSGICSGRNQSAGRLAVTSRYIAASGSDRSAGGSGRGMRSTCEVAPTRVSAATDRRPRWVVIRFSCFRCPDSGHRFLGAVSRARVAANSWKKGVYSFFGSTPLNSVRSEKCNTPPTQSDLPATDHGSMHNAHAEPLSRVLRG
jgi:hypothetical protein